LLEILSANLRNVPAILKTASLGLSARNFRFRERNQIFQLPDFQDLILDKWIYFQYFRNLNDILPYDFSAYYLTSGLLHTRDMLSDTLDGTTDIPRFSIGH